MRKKYTIEIPAYSRPIDHLISLSRRQDISIILYGGVPDSPLNGGRFNYALDGLFFWDRLFFHLTRRQLAKALSTFYATVRKANENKIPFLLAFTNMFVSPEELSGENLYPVKWLVESSRKHGVKNGLILNNPLLERSLREKYADELLYVSSCTKYVSADRILAPRETLEMYIQDSPRYDFVTLTPQDSRREGLIREALSGTRGNIIAICNSYCSDDCNPYFHYEFMSRENKRTLRKARNLSIVAEAFKFMAPRARRCAAFRQPFEKGRADSTARMQLKAGIVNFKLGRGFGADFLDKLVSLISRQEKSREALKT